MIYLSDIQELLSSWTDRLGNPALCQQYKDALNDCLYDLNMLVSNTIEAELNAYESIIQEEEVHEAA